MIGMITLIRGLNIARTTILIQELRTLGQLIGLFYIVHNGFYTVHN